MSKFEGGAVDVSPNQQRATCRGRAAHRSFVCMLHAACARPAHIQRARAARGGSELSSHFATFDRPARPDAPARSGHMT